MKRVVITVLWAGLLALQSSAATNYIVNGDGEQGWTSSAFNLRYDSQTATSATYWVDVANKRFQTFINGVKDMDIDLADFNNFENRRMVSDYLTSHGYTTTDLGWAGDPAINWYANADMLTSQSIAPYPGENILNSNYPVQARHQNAWGGYGLSGTNSSLIAHTGSYSIGVYDDRPSPWLAGSPESVNVSQQLSVTNPNWTDLKGKTVKLSGWLSTPAGDLHSYVGDSGGTVRVHHGVGGAAVQDISVWTGTSNFGWNYFEQQFTIAPNSDGITLVLFANANPNNVYWGAGHTLFDDLKLEIVPEPATIGLFCLGGLGLLRRRR